MKKNQNINYESELIKKIKSNSCKIGIIGLGYVGLPLSLTYSEKGFKVLGLDIDENKVDKINNGESYIHHISDHRIKKCLKDRELEATNDFSRSIESDVLILCVPTPLNKYREPDLSFIKATLSSLLPYFKKGQVLSLESTTYPGTTEEIIEPIIKDKGFTIGKDFFLIYSPEREDPGNDIYTTENIPKVMGGTTKSCSKVGLELYNKAINEVVSVSSTKAAEMTKLLENIHRAVNIGLMNELKPLADRMGIDLYEVIRAASTKPFGFVPYYPGPGLGGHCIPIDPFYLTWKAKEYGMNTKFIELAGEINTAMPAYVVEKLTNALNSAKKPVKGSKVLILGIAYKKNVDDMRESPSLEIMKILKAKGAEIFYSDPFFPEIPETRKYFFELKSIELSKKNIKSFDALILATDHDSFDYGLIENNSNILIDTRGRFMTSDSIIRA